MVSAPRPVVAAGLTPAWQQIVVLDELRRGAVNRAAETHACASGKVLNVAKALAALGAQQITAAPLGGLGGEQIRREWADAGLTARWTTTQTPTRVCTTVIERGSGTTTELVENAAALSADELAACLAAYLDAANGAALAVHSGSLPAGAPSDWYRTALRRTTVPVILDARELELLMALETRPLLVKPNREELARTVGHELADEAEVWAALESLREAGAVWALTTHGARPALLAGPTGHWRIESVGVQAVNPIGCGDCLTAGIAAHLAAHSLRLATPTAEEMLAAVRYGVAAAAANAEQLLPARIAPARVAEFSQRVNVQAAHA